MSSAHADDAQTCDDKTIKAVAAWAGVEEKLKPTSPDEEADDVESEADDNLESESDNWIANAACKAMPNAPGTTIAVIAFNTGVVPDWGFDCAGKECRNILEVIALVKAGKVVAASRSTDREDNYGYVVGIYRIDTARYRLSKDIRAFGIVFRNAARIPNCADNGYEGKLALWIREGKNLRPIFGINLRCWENHNPYSCRSPEDQIEEQELITISVEKTSSHGFADLAITAHVTQEWSCDRDDCSDRRRTVRKVMKYNGLYYDSSDDDVRLKCWDNYGPHPSAHW